MMILCSDATAKRNLLAETNIHSRESGSDTV